MMDLSKIWRNIQGFLLKSMISWNATMFWEFCGSLSHFGVQKEGLVNISLSVIFELLWTPSGSFRSDVSQILVNLLIEAKLKQDFRKWTSRNVWTTNLRISYVERSSIRSRLSYWNGKMPLSVWSCLLYEFGRLPFLRSIFSSLVRVTLSAQNQTWFLLWQYFRHSFKDARSSQFLSE